MATLGICHCCGTAPVSSDADACPRCGQWKPFLPADQSVLENGSTDQAMVVRNRFDEEAGCILTLEFSEGQKGFLHYSPHEIQLKSARRNHSIAATIQKYHNTYYVCSARQNA
jgi:hypothetical protein